LALLTRDPVFTALTRPQMFGGVSYSFFVLNMVLTTEAFLITKSFWALVAALALHLFGYVACKREPRWLDLMILRASRCPRVKNYAHWRCNSYAP
jgi:type IV secretion system protein VirB3